MEDKDINHGWVGVFVVVALLFAIGIGIFVVLPAQQAEIKKFCARYNYSGIHLDVEGYTINCSQVQEGDVYE